MKEKINHRKEKGSEKNFYKITTYVLLVLLILVGVCYLGNNYLNNKYEQKINEGRIQAVNSIITMINEKGSVSFVKDDNSTLTLVPASYIEMAQKQVVIEIMNRVKSDGGITLYNQNDSIVLVPAKLNAEQN